MDRLGKGCRALDEKAMNLRRKFCYSGHYFNENADAVALAPTENRAPN
jgi:hypothetical protein